MYFVLLILLKLLVLSVGTMDISLRYKICISLLIYLSYYFFYGISESHPIDRSSISSWIKNNSSLSEPFIVTLDLGHNSMLRPSSSNVSSSITLSESVLIPSTHLTKNISTEHNFFNWCTRCTLR